MEIVYLNNDPARHARIAEYFRQLDEAMEAVKKRPITEEMIDEVIDDIELKLLNRKTREVKTTEIGEMVLTRLKKLDTIGYLLFASVYRDFDSIADFESALTELKTI